MIEISSSRYWLRLAAAGIFSFFFFLFIFFSFLSFLFIIMHEFHVPWSRKMIEISSSRYSMHTFLFFSSFFNHYAWISCDYRKLNDVRVHEAGKWLRLAAAGTPYIVSLIIFIFRFSLQFSCNWLLVHKQRQTEAADDQQWQQQVPPCIVSFLFLFITMHGLWQYYNDQLSIFQAPGNSRHSMHSFIISLLLCIE